MILWPMPTWRFSRIPELPAAFSSFSQLEFPIRRPGRDLATSRQVTMIRQLISKAFLPNLEADLKRVVAKEVRSIEKDLCPLQTASVFSFSSSGSSGAFARTASAAAPARVFRVEKPTFQTCNGLFHS